MAYPEAKVSEFLSEFLQTNSSIEKPIRQLLGLHSRYLGITKKFHQDFQDLENRYLQQYRNLYEERSAVVNAVGNRESQPEHQQDYGQAVSQGIPEFWLVAMKNNPTISGAIHPDDEVALRHLKDVRMEYLPTLGFKLYFDFEENEFFTNKTLTKKFTYEHDEDDFTGELMNGETTADEIDWKYGMNLTLKAKPRPNGEHKVESFFEFFDTPNEDDEDIGGGSADDEESDEENSDDDDSVVWNLYTHFELGEEFKDTIIPHALYWYTGEAALDESSDEENGDDDDDDDDKDNEDR